MKKMNLFVTLALLTSFCAHAAKKVENWIPPDRGLRLDQISVLASHNALLSQEDGWIYAQQKWTLEKQLNNGIRAFEYDIAMNFAKDKKTKLYICHGTCENSKLLKIGGLLGEFVTFQKKMNELAAWLRKHPTEVVYVLLDNQRDKTIKPDAVDNEIENTPKVKELVLTKADWDPAQNNGDWPTLQWMNDHKKQIVIFNPAANSPRYTFSQWYYFVGSYGGPKVRKDSIKAFSPDQQEEQKLMQRFFQFNNVSRISQQYAIEGYKLFSKGVKTLEKQKIIKPNSIKLVNASGPLPKNTRAEILTLLESLKGGPLEGRKPNILLLDFDDQFIDDNGMELINQWNSEAANQLHENQPNQPATPVETAPRNTTLKLTPRQYRQQLPQLRTMKPVWEKPLPRARQNIQPNGNNEMEAVE